MGLIISCDDGCASDVRLAELASKYGVRCIFYIPVEWHSLALYKGYKPLTIEQAWDLSSEFEIGAHTITHRQLTDLPLEEAKKEISECLPMMETLLQCTISRFAPPRGYTNPELTEYTLKHYSSQRLTKGKGLVHIHPESGVNDHEDWLDRAKDVKELWCHSWELDKFDLWRELEAFLERNRENT